jgi:hypothetical protein
MEKFMEPIKTKKKAIKWMETAFDAAYLATVFVSAALLCYGADGGSARRRFGVMALILGLGDACHLMPRIAAMWDARRGYAAALGAGKLIASVTMTAFYVALWHIGTSAYPGVAAGYMDALVYGVAALRVALCLLPQNRWTVEDSPRKWAIARNIPFFLLGLFVARLYAVGAFTQGGALSFIWIFILISFACYLPVVLFSGRSAKVGMLMLPKSCAYAAIVLTGFLLTGA